MINRFIKKVIQAFKRTYFRIFKTEISSTIEHLLRGLFWSYLGTFTAAGVMFAVSILAGRLLGPSEYGKYNLVIAVSNIIIIFILAGLEAATVKYVAGAREEKDKNKFLSNSIYIVTAANIVVLLATFLFRSKISSFFKIDLTIFLFALLFSLFSSYKSILDTIIKSLKRFKFQALMKSIESIIIITSFFIVVILLKNNSYKAYLLSVAIGAVFVVIVYLISLKHQLVKWSPSSFLKTKKYLKLSLPISIFGAISANIDKIFVGVIMSPKDLGIYSAYILSSVVIFSQIIMATYNVLFPVMSQVEDKAQAIKKIDRLALVLFVPLVLLVSLTSLLVMALFGKDYQINWLFIFLVSIATFFQLVVVMYSAVVSSSRRLLSFNVFFCYAKPLYLALLYYLVIYFKKEDIPYIFLVLILSYLFDIAAVKITFKVLKSKEK